jgi:polysaccharide biosynthesis protein PslA
MANIFEHRIASQQEFAESARRHVSLEIVAGVVQFLDFCAIPLAGWMAWYFYNTRIVGEAGPQDRYTLTAILGAILFALNMRLSGGYLPDRLELLGWQVGRVASSWAGSLTMLLTIAYLGKAAAFYSRGWALGWTLLSLGTLVLIRLGLVTLLRQWSRQGRLARVVAVVGTGDAGEQVVAKLQAASREQIAIAGIFDDRRTRVPTGIAGHTIAGTTDHLIALARRQEIDEIIIALPLSATERIGQLVTKLRSLPIDLRLSIDPVAGDFPMIGIGQIAGVPVIEIADRPLKHWSGVAKSVEDKMLGMLLLVLFAPVMAVIALAIRLDSPGPVLFLQERYGFNNRPLRLYKFRTMRADAADPSGGQRTVRNDPRLTRIGRVLRSFSLDELPQLLNVVLGDMSLVGPRPHAPAMQAGDRLYHDAVDDYFRRHRVRPGITGWAQVNGSRGEIDSLETARRRVAYDLYYIENWSLLLDLKILLKTLPVVLSRQGAY